MIVVVILGVLASVAVPAFLNYLRKAKSAEAEDKVSQIYRTAVSYFHAEQFERGLEDAINPQFPEDEGPSPGACETECAMQGDGRCHPSAMVPGSYDPDEIWDTPTWIALDFGINDPHYFVYQFASTNADVRGGAGSVFTARAMANLDGDDVCSTFERAGVANEFGEVEGSRGVYRYLPTE